MILAQDEQLLNMGDRVVILPRECPKCRSDEIDFIPIWMKNEVKCTCSNCDNEWWE